MNPFSTLKMTGCTSAPLAHYLKALGMFRLVTEQADKSARGFWGNGCFHLTTILNSEDLVSFFLRGYRPSPLVAPWNGGSGFYEGDEQTGLHAILGTSEERFAIYREVINTVRKWPELGPSNRSLGDLREEVAQEAPRLKGKAADDLRKLVVDCDKALAAYAIYGNRDQILEGSPEAIESHKTSGKSLTREEKTRNESLNEVLRVAKKLRTLVKKLHRSAGKETLVLLARSRLPDAAVDCLDAMVPMLSDGSLGFPPLFGAGGAEGRFDYTTAFMGHLAGMLIHPPVGCDPASLLRHSLFGEFATDFQNSAVGQHDPGRAGGFNQGPEIETKRVPMNPWNFIFCMEGCIVWASGAGKRLGAESNSILSSPFTVQARATGYGSASAQDEAKAEVWTPLWAAPASYSELAQTLREGRAEIGHRQARHTIEFAEAASGLGVDRGIKEFGRFSLLKRRGDSYVALPVGLFPVQYRKEADLVRELDPILRRIDQFLAAFGKQGPPARFDSARRNIDEAMYQLLLQGGPRHVKRLIAALGRMEILFAERELNRKPKLAAPLGGLSHRWILAADDGSPEVRLAAALAGVAACGPVGPLRSNLAPVDPRMPWRWAKNGLSVAWSGHSLQVRLAAVLQRRMLDADRLNAPSNPLNGYIRLHPLDALGLLGQKLDQTALEELLFGFSWVRWDAGESASRLCEEIQQAWSDPVRDGTISRAYALLKHLFLPAPLRLPGNTKSLIISPEREIVPLLCANRVSEACVVAQRRLITSGLAVIRSVFPDTTGGTALAAALLVPVCNVHSLSRLILHKQTDNN